MKIDENTGLVLEGGGMRGIFTIGVLDAFMEYGIRFPYVIGVSAGACNLCSYVSEQPGRARYSNIDMMEQYNYISIKNLIKQGNIFDTKLLYDRLPNEIYPFDYDKFFNSPTEYEIVATNCQTGKPEYLADHSDRKRIMDIILASSSLPYVAKTVSVDGVPMLDGGVVDSIPVKRAISKGHPTNVLVRTRNYGYRKIESNSPVKRKMVRWLNKTMYHNYPNFASALDNRLDRYNSQLEYVEQLEKEGKVLVIRPEKPIVVDRVERNVERLTHLYDEGKRIGKIFVEQHYFSE